MQGKVVFFFLSFQGRSLRALPVGGWRRGVLARRQLCYQKE
jgi:hypothetical protein